MALSTVRAGSMTGLVRTGTGVIVQAGSRADLDGREILLCEGQ